MDTVIHDNVLRGSPIMSYGEPPRTGRMLKLLALLAGSFLVLVFVLSAVAWFVLRLPLPQKTVLTLAVWPSADLGQSIPDVWRRVRSANDPLPTLVGFARDAQTGQPAPFALRFPSLFDGQTYRTAKWGVESDGSFEYGQDMAMSQAFGSFLTLPWAKPVVLTVYPRQALDYGDVGADLPEKIQGAVENRVWATDYSIQDNDMGLFAATNTSDGSALALSAESALPLGNFASLNGSVWPLPAAGGLEWIQTASATRISLKTAQGLEVQSRLGLGVAHGLFGRKDGLLEDGTGIVSLVPPASVSGTAVEYVDFDISPWPVSVSSDVANRDACPGKRLMQLDRTSTKNVCLWLGVCWSDLQFLDLRDVNGRFNVCF